MLMPEISSRRTASSASSRRFSASTCALAPPQLGQQPRVLDGDGRLLGEVQHQAHVVLIERALAQPVVDVDGPGRRAP